jgi:hypothetical protein
MSVTLRALVVPYRTCEDENGAYRVAPGAVKLAASQDVAIVDAAGDELGSIRRGNLRLFDAGPRSEFGPSGGLAMELTLDSENEAHHRAVETAREEGSGLSAIFDESKTQSRLEKGVTIFTLLTIRQIVLTADNPDPGTSLGYLVDEQTAALSRRAGYLVTA